MFSQQLTFVRRAGPELWRRYRAEARRPILPAPRVPAPQKWPDRGLFAAWLGHSTVLLKIDGLTILTDPVLSDRCGISVGPFTVGLRRLVAPALDHLQLPRIDLILLSHAHMDHFDVPTLRRLERKHTDVVTAAHTADLLRVPRYKAVHELGWDEQVRIGDLSIRALEVRHWGARMRSDTFRGYNGYLLETDRYRVVFAGDTAATRLFQKAKNHRPVNLAMVPIGAYNPWVSAHCNPEEALQIANDCGAEALLPIHHQTFELSREPYYEPIQRFNEAARERVALQQIGEEWATT